MKIIDSNGNPIDTPDLTKGYLKQETQTIHHDAVVGVEEVSHYEYKTYPNGGKDRWKVVDVPGVAAKEAYDEEVEVQRYVLYTAEELAAQERPARKQRKRHSYPPQKSALLLWKRLCLTCWPHSKEDVMVLFYVTQIKLHRFDGAFTIDSVPDRYKDAVLAKLTEEGFYDVESDV